MREGLRRARSCREGPQSYFRHEESPKLEEGHGEAQHGASRPCSHQGPNADSLYPRQVIARLSPYPPPISPSHVAAWLLAMVKKTSEKIFSESHETLDEI